jgi:hypothetical protein
MLNGLSRGEQSTGDGQYKLVDGLEEDKELSGRDEEGGERDVLNFRILMTARVVGIEAAGDGSVTVGVPVGLYGKALA